MQHIYGIFGFEFTLELSTRPENYLGELSLWETAEKVSTPSTSLTPPQQLSDILNEYSKETGRPWKLNPGDGAFYGPKIDIHIEDALKRSHQCATIQLDFQLPIRFGLEVIYLTFSYSSIQYQSDKDSKPERPVIIHRAIYGSIERFLAILIEHTAGKWYLFC